jgi:hypothetical protein
MVSLVLWIGALSKVNLSWAYPCVALGFVLTVARGHLIFGEAVSLSKLLGSPRSSPARAPWPWLVRHSSCDLANSRWAANFAGRERPEPNEGAVLPSGCGTARKGIAIDRRHCPRAGDQHRHDARPLATDFGSVDPPGGCLLTDAFSQCFRAERRRGHAHVGNRRRARRDLDRPGHVVRVADGRALRGRGSAIGYHRSRAFDREQAPVIVGDDQQERFARSVLISYDSQVRVASSPRCDRSKERVAPARPTPRSARARTGEAPVAGGPAPSNSCSPSSGWVSSAVQDGAAQFADHRCAVFRRWYPRRQRISGSCNGLHLMPPRRYQHRRGGVGALVGLRPMPPCERGYA